MGFFALVRQKIRQVARFLIGGKVRAWVGRKKAAPVLTIQDATRFINFIANAPGKHAKLHAAALVVQLFTGARIEDCFSIRKRDISIRYKKSGDTVDAITIWITNFKTNRRKKMTDSLIMNSRAARTVYMSPEAKLAFLVHLQDFATRDDDDFLFMNGNWAEMKRNAGGKPKFEYSSAFETLANTIRAQRRHFVPMCPHVDPNEISSHSFRKAAVTCMVEQGVPLPTVATYIQQANTSSIRFYNETSYDQLDQAARKLVLKLKETKQKPSFVKKKLKNTVKKTMMKVPSRRSLK